MPEFGAEVLIHSGPVVGIEADEGTLGWLGIPYAAPPLGSLRWRPPQDPEPWTVPLMADTVSPYCPQIESSDSDGDGEPELKYIGQEDCLYLNVWRPKAQAQRLRPIMLWIHGGGNVQGSASDPLYEGDRLAARNDVVLVSLNYRLNVFGYLYHESLQNGDLLNDSGNYGTLDILKVLDWIQENGVSFGGDPSNVTVFGESAGGVNTWAMMQSPLAEDKFHRAIIESGCANTSTPTQARAHAQEILEQLIVADGLATEETAAAYLDSQGDAWIGSYLYGKTPEEVLAVFIEGGGFDLSEFDPVSDGVVLSAGGVADIESGNYNRVPVIIGSNAEEMKLFYYGLYNMNEVQYNALMRALFGEDVEEVESYYPRTNYSPATPYNQFIDVADAVLELTCGQYAAWLVAPYQPTWLYHFRYTGLTEPYDYILGAAHGLELPFVFGHTTGALYPSDEASVLERNTLQATVSHYWGCLAYDGDPNCDKPGPLEPVEAPFWKTVHRDPEGGYVRVVLDSAVQEEPMPLADMERINFWLDYGNSTLPRIPLP